MRIQETDRILKESRNARHTASQHPSQGEGIVQRVWRGIMRFFK